MILKFAMWSLNGLIEPWEVPYRWRHAALSEMRDFLKSERDAGRYHQILTDGLDD